MTRIRIILIIAVVFSYISCLDEDFDKHPDVPFFEELSSTTLKFTPVENHLSFINNTKDYVYLYDTINAKIEIYNIEGKELIKVIPNVNSKSFMV